MPRYREPKCCWNCSSPTAIAKYEEKIKGGKFKSEPNQISDLTIMRQGTGADKLAFLCDECGFARAIQTTKPLWWVTCMICRTKSVSDVQDKCPKCNDG